MRRIGIWSLLILCLSCAPASAECTQSWIFNRSYYSHFPLHPVQIGPKSVDGPYFTKPVGTYFSGGYRRSNSWINIPGAAYDNTQTIEAWGQVGAKF